MFACLIDRPLARGLGLGAIAAAIAFVAPACAVNESGTPRCHVARRRVTPSRARLSDQRAARGLWEWRGHARRRGHQAPAIPAAGHDDVRDHRLGVDRAGGRARRRDVARWHAGRPARPERPSRPTRAPRGREPDVGERRRPRAGHDRTATRSRTARRSIERTGFRTAPTADDPSPMRFLAFGDSGGGGSDQYALREQMFAVPVRADHPHRRRRVRRRHDRAVRGQRVRRLRRAVPQHPVLPGCGKPRLHTRCRARRSAPCSRCPVTAARSGTRTTGAASTSSRSTPRPTTRRRPRGSTQDLAARTLPWKIVYLHQPPYSSGDHGSDTALRSKLAPVFEHHGVQLVLAGHDHDYERDDAAARRRVRRDRWWRATAPAASARRASPRSPTTSSTSSTPRSESTSWCSTPSTRPASSSTRWSFRERRRDDDSRLVTISQVAR